MVSESSQSYVYCQGCQAYIQWTPITDGELDLSANTKGLKPGHYMLTENVTTLQKQLNPDGANPGTFCFDLNGYEYHGATRAFYVYTNAVLNLQDSRGGATVQGDKSTGYGGTLYTQGTGTINLYSGTVLPTPIVCMRGSSIFLNSGTVNIYGGTVYGGEVSGRSGTVDCCAGGSLNIFGGTVLAGKSDGTADCVYVESGSTVSVGGNALVDEIYMNMAPADAITVDTTAQAFTGTVTLRYKTQPTAAGVDVGNITGTLGMADANVSLSGNGMQVAAEGTNLVTVISGVDICADGTVLQHFTTLSKALAAYTYEAESRNYIRICTDITDAVTVSGDVYLDLNGHDIKGDITVAQGATLYCMDSQTDDYVALDENGYGFLTGTITGNVEPVPVSTVSHVESSTNGYRAGYLKVVRSSGWSFHRVNLQVESMALRPSVVGVYYQCPFLADEVASEEVFAFGVALSVYAVPNAFNLDTYCESSRFTDITDKEQVATGTLLRYIMRPQNTAKVNASNANVKIFGRAYIETSEGVLFGEPVERTLQEQVAGVDAAWDTLTDVQKQGVLEMYETYENVMSGWNLPNIKEGA